MSSKLVERLISFQYDRFGNRRFDANNTTTLGSCSQAQCNPLINTSDNRFSSGQNYIYDENGNLTRDANSKKFTYDAENHQIKVETVDANGNPISTNGEYLYDGEGKRVKKISSTEITVFVYNGGGTLVAEYSTQQATTPQVSYLTADHLGSPRVITNQNGAVTTRKDYMAFGDEASSAQRTANPNYDSSETRKGYTGYEKDTESGLEFAQARYYNSTHGRFTSIDPLMASATIKNPQTFNRYSYVLNSPYKFTDPLGLISVTTGACGSSCPNSGGGVDGSAFRGTDTTFEHLKTINQIAREFIDKIVAALGGLGGQFRPLNNSTSQTQNNDKQKKELRINLTDPNNLLDEDNLNAMKKELSEIYAGINVVVIFTDIDPNYTLSVQQDRAKFTKTENAVGATSVNIETKVVSSNGTVFINQAMNSINSTSEGEAAAKMDSKALGKALGRAASHEIGHYLLQQIDHSTTGVMRDGFKGEEWFTMRTRGLWQFSKEQKRIIRAQLPNREEKKK